MACTDSDELSQQISADGPTHRVVDAYDRKNGTYAPRSEPGSLGGPAMKPPTVNDKSPFGGAKG